MRPADTTFRFTFRITNGSPGITSISARPSNAIRRGSRARQGLSRAGVDSHVAIPTEVAGSRTIRGPKRGFAQQPAIAETIAGFSFNLAVIAAPISAAGLWFRRQAAATVPLAPWVHRCQ